MSSKRKLENSEEDSDVDHQDKKVKRDKVISRSEEAVFDLGSKRKLTVSVFKGRVLVNIREYYEDKNSGDLKPGSKGIALTSDQWSQLVEQFDEIKEAVDARK
mmetsp:Transcript_31415/g.23334  ORF Transcript_31415/g.23334 Transcript_31415/m.23334 type:complete len:103 (+) Transcript_31415:19-327(+)